MRHMEGKGVFDEKISKRIIDIVISGLGLIILSPFLFLIAILIKVDSPEGTIIFKQNRVGLKGRIFILYKFRSMIPEAEQLKNSLQNLNEMSGPVFKIKKDPRITRLGRLIRKTSIDELPQLINVFKGDMSLVGPRPLPVEEMSKIEQYIYQKRSSVKPGITCIWQISGRNNIDFDKWMEMDIEYIDNWSLGLDLKILFFTFPAVLIGKGAN
ncbi:MAG: multidrug MFS transporter [Peptococcaceae bacterium BICA1-8]|nr:MAG: multidrug MFS transporter [Peptococcaceae bacterium BICA1-8]